MPRRKLPGLALALCFVNLATAATSMQSQEDLNKTADSFYAGLAIDETNIYEVKDATLSKDIGSFKLASGTLYLAKPINGLITGAVFIGEGSVLIKPTRPMDRKCLELSSQEHLKKKLDGQLSTTFKELVILSLDDSLADFVKTLKIGGLATGTARASEILKDRQNVWKSQETTFDLTFTEKMAGLHEGPLVLEFNSTDLGWLAFTFSPRQTYEVVLLSRERVGMFYLDHRLINTHKLAEFDAAGVYIGDALKDQKDLIDVKRYKMEITIPDTNHFLVEADVTFSPLVDNLEIVDFDLVNNIAGSRSTEKAKPIYLNQVTDSAGNKLPFVHRKNTILVVPSEPLKRGTDYTFHFSLDEQTIIQLSSVHYFVLNTYPWFPQHGYLGGKYGMEWTIKAKKPLVATGSGRIVREESDRTFNITQLVFEKDVQFPSLIFGQYQKVLDSYKTTQSGTNVDLAVYSWPSATFFIPSDDGPPVSVNVTVPGSKPKSILEEAKEIIKFCENLYGPFPYETLQVAQMSPGLGFGQAPPGFVQLTGEAFMSSADIANFSRGNADFFHEFFSHEIAHQWWGHTIAWASDEDVWLSESYAEYTAGLYVMQLLGQVRFQGKLKEWKDLAKIADPHAPIAWANSVSGTNAGLWRTGLIYNKGPYVVHMLRMQVGHENFVKAMKNLTAKYRYQQITTDQLKQEFEAVVGYKLDYFFDQWYRGTGIPVFDYSTSVQPTPDGKWLATVKISQRDKENFKVVSMPVFFHFGKDKVLAKDRPVLKADDVYQVKLAEKPENITLDDYHTLLADYVKQTSGAGQP